MRLQNRHDAEVWSCLQHLLGIEGDQLTEDVVRLPLSMGGLGLRSAVRTSHAAHWASWADSAPMIQKRHPGVVRLIVAQLTDQVDSSLPFEWRNSEQRATFRCQFRRSHLGSDC